MISINLYKFNKKPNSTKVPTEYTTGASFSCEIVEDCSIINPIVIIKGMTNNASDFTKNLSDYNYAYIFPFNRYYFINDVVYNAHDGFWHFHLSVDVLASAKSQILNTLQFVERSSLTYDLDVIDNFYPSKATPEYFNTTLSTFFPVLPSSSDAQYIIGMVSKGANMSRFGGLQYWLLTGTQMNDLIDYMMGVTNYTDATLLGITTDLLGFIGEPLQYIASCKFLPRKLFDTTQMTATPITFGGYTSTVNGYKLSINNPMFTDGFTIQLHDHPQKATRGSWLNGNTHTERVLRFEPFGVIPIDSSRLLGYSYLACQVAIDIVTGAGVLSLYASPETWSLISNIDQLPLLGTYPSQVLIDIPLSQFRHEGYLKAFMENVIRPNSELVTGIAKGFVGGGYIGAGASALEGASNNYWSIINGAENFNGAPRSQGVPSAFLSRLPVILSQKYSILVDEDLSQFGRPLCRPKSLADLTGYCQCRGADLTTNLTDKENASIVAFLNSGIFIE